MVNVEEFKDRMEEYYYAFGEFMHQVGATENALNAVALNFVSNYLRHDVKDSYPVLRAVMGGQSISAISETLKRLIKAVNATDDRQQELGQLLNHMAQIAFLRNRLAHNSASADMTRPGGWYLSFNSITTRDIAKIGSVQFTTRTLLAAACDAQVIAERVHRAMEPSFFEKGDNTAEGDKHRRTLFEPWHYNPAILVGDIDEPEGPPAKKPSRRQRRDAAMKQ